MGTNLSTDRQAFGLCKSADSLTRSHVLTEDLNRLEDKNPIEFEVRYVRMFFKNSSIFDFGGKKQEYGGKKCYTP